MSAEFVKWSDVKAKARSLDPRSDAEREAGQLAARARQEAYRRDYQLLVEDRASSLTATPADWKSRGKPPAV